MTYDTGAVNTGAAAHHHDTSFDHHHHDHNDHGHHHHDHNDHGHHHHDHNGSHSDEDPYAHDPALDDLILTQNQPGRVYMPDYPVRWQQQRGGRGSGDGNEFKWFVLIFLVIVLVFVGVYQAVGGGWGNEGI